MTEYAKQNLHKDIIRHISHFSFQSSCPSFYSKRFFSCRYVCTLGERRWGHIMEKNVFS